MKIDLTEVLQKAGNEVDIEETDKISFPDDDLNLSKPVKVQLHLVNVGDSVYLTGTAETEAELECSRCLKKYKVPLAIDLEEEFSKEPFISKSSGSTELRPEDFVYPIEEDNTIDLSEMIRQDLLLSIPIKTLCSPDCKGIKGEK
ncbi:MAG: YceD family protein [Candidatus Margulisiibacteriota bacterium]|nr:YceD family protein [Candidatus Margulisiibacteriota bacterium]